MFSSHWQADLLGYFKKKDQEKLFVNKSWIRQESVGVYCIFRSLKITF